MNYPRFFAVTAYVTGVGMADEQGKAKETQVVAASGEQGEKKEVPFNDHPRWKEVYGELQEFKKAGVSAADLTARLQEAEELKAAFAEAIELARQETQKTQGNEAANRQQAEARAAVVALFPQLENLERLSAQVQQRNQRLERAAVSETKKLLSTAGLDDSTQEVATLSDTLADIIKNDPDLFDEYDINPRQAVRGAYDKFVAKFQKVGERASKAAAQKDRENTRSLPKAHGAGGSTESGGEAVKPAKTLAEAAERVKARLKGMDLKDL